MGDFLGRISGSSVQGIKMDRIDVQTGVERALWRVLGDYVPTPEQERQRFIDRAAVHWYAQWATGEDPFLVSIRAFDRAEALWTERQHRIEQEKKNNE